MSTTRIPAQRYSGDLIIQAPDDALPPEALMRELGLSVSPLVQRFSRASLAALEGMIPVKPAWYVSLTRFWRVWLRHSPWRMGPVAQLLSTSWPGAVVWPELAAVPSGTLTPLQTHRYAPPTGCNVQAANAAGARGQGVTLTLIDLGFRPNHADLKSATVPTISGDNIGNGTSQHPHAIAKANHGTSMAAMLVGDSQFGTTGIAPAATLRFASSHRAATRSDEHIVDAVLGAMLNNPTRGPIVLGLGRGGFPAEAEPGDRMVIWLAGAFGFPVIAPAGNGGLDLDQDAPFLTTEDTGSILVGAVQPGATGRPWASNHGSRVTVQAPGTGLVTAGAPFGALVSDIKTLDGVWRSDFGGTCGAAAIVGGLAALAGPGVTPGVLRAWFSNMGSRPDATLPLPTGPAMTFRTPVLTSAKPKGGTVSLAVSQPQIPGGTSGVWDPGGHSGSSSARAYGFLDMNSAGAPFCLPGGLLPALGAPQVQEQWSWGTPPPSFTVDSEWFWIGPNPPPAQPNVTTSTLFGYVLAPPTPAPAPIAATLHHFHVFEGGVRTAEMFRELSGSRPVREWWVFEAGYHFPTAASGREVKYLGTGTHADLNQMVANANLAKKQYAGFTLP